MVSDSLRSAIRDYIEANRLRLVSELQDFLRQKSISTENVGMDECARFLKWTSI